MTILKISEARQRDDIQGRAQARTYLERASTLVLNYDATIALDALAGDTPVGEVLYDCKFLGGFLEVSGNEGVDGEIVIEKWVSIAGAQTSISDALAINGGAAAIYTIVAVATGDEYVTGGYKINLKRTTAVGNAVVGKLTLYFRTIDNIGRSG